jgi:geranylgeranylglycerol-phosphate geranylgeranyltransferase
MWREVIELSRPKNIILAMITVPLGAYLASPNLSPNLFGLVALQTTSVAFFMAAGNTFNDISDISIDKAVKSDKPLPSERISVNSATRIAYGFSLLSLISMLIGAYLLKEDRIYVAVIWLLAAMLIYTYDMGPQTKRMGLVGNIAISLMVGAVILYGAASIGKLFIPLVFYAAGVAFFANLAREIIKDCEDMESDEGRNTLPMRIGLEKSRMLSYLLILSALVVLFIPHWIGPLTPNQLLIQSPAMILLITLNAPMMKGDDHSVQQRIRMGMLLGLMAFAVEVSI